MKLTYTIAWLDDQPHNVEEIAEGVRIRLERRGLELEIEWIKSFKDIKGIMTSLRRRQDVIDLILLDWDLGQGSTSGLDGAELARRVRISLPYTDIVFYSSATPRELRARVADKDVDGVYCTHRNDLVTVAVEVAGRMTRRTLSLEALRGAFIVYATELDHLLTESLQLVYDRLEEDHKAEFVESVVDRLKQAAESSVEELGNLGGSSLDDLLGTYAFGSDQRLRALLRGLEMLEDELDSTVFRGTLERYRDDVLTPRNIFAHQRATRNKKGKLMFESKFMLDDGTVERLRTNLLQHGQNLDDLRSLLKR